MSTPQPATEPTRKRRILRAVGGLLVLAVLLAGAAFLQQRGQADAASAVTSSDSTQVALGDSAMADSTVTVKKGGGFFSFLKRDAKEQESEKKEKDAGVPVEMALSHLRDVPLYFTGTATVEALQETKILAKIAGTIEKILVEEGDHVEAGQLLLQIDDSEEKARLMELRVRAMSLENDFDRTKSLLKKELTSARDYEDKKLLMEEAQAKFHVGEIRLAYTQVRAAFSGRITLRQVDVGEYVQLNQELFGLADFDPLLVRVYLPEKEADRVSVGQKVTVIANAATERRYHARVRMVSPIVDTASGTVKVTVEIREKTKLRIGAFVRVQITTDVHENALVIPKLALIEEGGETYVYRAQADSVVKVRVQTGYADESITEVLVGLENGDRVVTVGQGGLKHGSRVRDLGATAVATDSTHVENSNDIEDVARR